MEKSKDRENRFRGKGTRKHKAETQKLTPMDESTSHKQAGLTIKIQQVNESSKRRTREKVGSRLFMECSAVNSFPLP